jgi:hypothetical protein
LGFAVNSVSSDAEFHSDSRRALSRILDDRNGPFLLLRSAAVIDPWQRHCEIQHSLANPTCECTAVVFDMIADSSKFRTDSGREQHLRALRAIGSAFGTSSFIIPTVY